MSHFGNYISAVSERIKIQKSRRKKIKQLRKLNKGYSYTPYKGDNGLFNMVYVLEHKLSKCFYIGVHSSNIYDILNGYTTSSELINKIIDVQGISAFDVVACVYAKTRGGANALERNLIISNFKSAYNLNMAYQVDGSDQVIKKPFLVENYHGVFHHACKLHINSNESIFNTHIISESINLIKTPFVPSGVKRAPAPVKKIMKYDPFSVKQ